MSTTKHTCTGPVFGRKTKGCPRCDELIAGAEPVRWSIRVTRKQQELLQIQAIREHFSSQKHLTGGCGPCCTFGEW